jgi:hypothetical protein
MSAVIDMQSWKARRVPRTAPATPATGEMLYFCVACDSEQFRIFQSGAVRCGQCNAELRRSAPSPFALSVLPFFLPFTRWWYAPLTKT